MFDIEALDIFYKDLSVPNGMTMKDFHLRLASLFAEERSPQDIEDYRLGKNPWKKLRDEVTPVSRFLKFNDVRAKKIRFPLDNKTPDCWLLNTNGENRGIEVTIERGREEYHLSKELNESGIGRGFIGVLDDAPQTEFNSRISNPPSMYSTEQALEVTKQGILRCLLKKNNQRYSKVYYLLIHAHLSTLPKQRWSAIQQELSEVAACLSFTEVHIIGNADSESWGFQIK